MTTHPSSRRLGSAPPASEAMRFFKAWLSDPVRVASVAPSSPSLADLITSEIRPDGAPVLELGPGTGAFTRALLARGVGEADLVLVEYGSDFARDLSLRYPEARVLWMDAARLATDPSVIGPRAPGAAVSGLPVLTMRADKQRAILDGVFRAMRPGAALYQFTYMPVCPIRAEVLDALDLEAVRIGGTLRNLPPASVYRVARRARAEG